MHPSFANAMPADAAAPAVDGFLSFCNQMRAKQEFFQHLFRDGEGKHSGQTQTSRLQRFGFELHFVPSWVVSSIRVGIGMQTKSPTGEAGKTPTAKSGLEGLGRAAELQEQGSSLTAAFPRSFPGSFPNSHSTDGTERLWGRQICGAEAPRAAPDGRAVLQEGACLLLPPNLSLQVGVSSLLDSFGTLRLQRPVEMQCHQVGFGAHRGLEQQWGGAENH